MQQGARAMRPWYLECPGQHPHRPSLHVLPLLEMRRAQLVPCREPGLGGWAGKLRHYDHPWGSCGLRVHQPQSLCLSKDLVEAAHKVSCRPGKENSPLFWEKKIKFPVFPSQNAFSFQSQSLGPRLFKRCIIFCYIHANKKIIHGLRLCKRFALDGQDSGKHMF